ncbi:hypothetical protein FE257_009582 [Aspergillus nanangensis]|uniref:U1-C C2H2-type zinc finger domain-containing protein n=1 Tax=Aspergillus nanangensis TaxID=2582783 RepID=A0AAD4CJV9_ASPNN|nr:hypothetical protein FE257_009582 [Aspergillus nanangensis]
MAEFWKSAPKYWCKQCKVFIRDTAFEKTQHEATGRHQGNLKRFLRDIHRNNEQAQRETQRAKNEVERLRQTVSGGTTPKTDGDTAAAPWKRAAAAPTAPEPAPRPISVEERKKQMAQLAEMGVAVPEEFRGDMALAGDWQTVSQRVIGSEEGEEKKTVGVRKRKHETAEDEEEQEARREAERFVSKPWGSRMRMYPGKGQDDDDLDELLASTKDIKTGKLSEDVAAEEQVEEVPAVKEESNDAAPADSEKPPLVKEELSATIPKDEPEDGPPAGGVVFKKRKPKVMRK